MDQTQIREQLRAGRLQLSLWETIEHYFFVVPTLFFPVFLLAIDESAMDTVSSKMLVMGVGVLLLVAYFVFNRYKALEFDKYPIEHTSADFQAAAKATAIALG